MLVVVIGNNVVDDEGKVVGTEEVERFVEDGRRH